MTARTSDWGRFVNNLELKDLLLPTAVFVGGAVLGRVFGFKPILRGATAALALATAVKDAGIVETVSFDSHRPGPRRKTAATLRTAVKRTPRKKSVRKPSVKATVAA